MPSESTSTALGSRVAPVAQGGPFLSLKAALLGIGISSLAACTNLPESGSEQPQFSDRVTPISLPAIALRPLPAHPAPGNLWQRLRTGFSLPPTTADAAAIEPYLQRYATVLQQHVSGRGARYLHYIIDQVAEQGLPMELALVPMVESTFDPFAYSHGRAAGLWQFIPSTGRKFGLQQDWWHDQRRDLIASTEAALAYLQSLHRQFDGDWLLALAAYNAGPGNVRRAIRRNREAGRPVDFFHLNHLPAETRSYIPRILALRELISQPQAHGIELPPLPDSAYFSIVEIGAQLDLARAAELAAIDINELYRLNPGLNRWATHPEGPHRLLVPVEAAERLREGLVDLDPEQRVSWQRHLVQPGESLSVIARRYRTSTATLQRHNNLDNHLIRAGQALLVPSASSPPQHYPLSHSQRASEREARLDRELAGRQKIEHEVRPGDSFWTLARKYQVSMQALASWNGMATRDPLRIGQKLAVWIPDGQRFSAAQARAMNASLPGREDVTRRVSYRVRKGDSLARIAGRFSVSVNQIVQWNDLNPRQYLQPGQQLALYVNVIGP